MSDSGLPLALRNWHKVVVSRDRLVLHDLLHQDVVFHSPVVHTPQVGRAICLQYLMGAMTVLNTNQFKYLREIVGQREALLEFSTEIDGIQINGIDLISWDCNQQITDFKVMLRPLKAVNMVHQKMAVLLQSIAERG
jgi:hypothetical protein